MLNAVTTVAVVLLGVHIIAMFEFFTLPYARRRSALDKSYGDSPPATKLPIGCCWLSGWGWARSCCGAPWRPWPQMAVLAILVMWSLIEIVRSS